MYGYDYLGLKQEEGEDHEPDIYILPVPYDATTSYYPGARFGPAAILAASPQVETFDDELKWDLTDRAVIRTLPPVDPNVSSPGAMLGRIRERVEPLILDEEKFILTFGGEHTVAIPLIEAYYKRYPNLTVVQIDAHADLREEWEGSRVGHACTMRPIAGHGIPIYQFGSRNLADEEWRFVREHPEQIFIFRAEELQDRRFLDDSLIRFRQEELGPVYITIDVDGFDPLVFPGTGTPEPGGLTWYQGLRIIRSICQLSHVVGADICEVSPVAGSHISEFAAAKLSYKLLCYAFYKRFRGSGS